MPKNKEKKRDKKAYNLKLNLKAISEVLSAVKDYLFPYEKISKKFSKINSESDLAIFIKEKSANFEKSEKLLVALSFNDLDFSDINCSLYAL